MKGITWFRFKRVLLKTSASFGRALSIDRRARYRHPPQKRRCELLERKSQSSNGIEMPRVRRLHPSALLTRFAGVSDATKRLY